MHEPHSACHRPTQISRKEDDLMDRSKIMIGIARYRLSAGRAIRLPKLQDAITPVRLDAGVPFPCRCSGDSLLTPGTRQTRRIPVIHTREYQSGKRTMRPLSPDTDVSFLKEPRTRMNDDHTMHISGISSYRNVNASDKRPGPGADMHRHCSGPSLTPEYRGLQPHL